MIAFCTTCRGRAQHIKLTLPKNLKDNPGPNSKFVLVDYSSQDDLVEYLRSHHAMDIASGKLIVYHYPNVEKFRMAHAKNMAHRLGIAEGGTVLVNLDADNYTGPNFDEYLEEKFKEPNIFMWARVMQANGDRLKRGASGRIVVSAKDFINVGGYDEKYEHWASDDKDFSARLRSCGIAGREIDPKYLDLVLHNDKMRFRDYPHIRDSTDSGAFFVAPEGIIANFGNIGCGLVLRNFGVVVQLLPVPTRIFGIGMHKTATTSLHHALEILGYDSAHWISAHWAKAIWREMRELRRSPTLERHYALGDLPIPILYEQLDRAYPGSKFILTTREERGWLKTVERHWSRDFNPFRSSWDKDPFTHKIHREVYGRKNFDPQVMLARYRKHNADVLAYFKNRPQDLLVMDMDLGWPKRNDEGAGWYELCGFLEKPIPRMPYPKSFAAY
jgi:hypothetical protein